MLLGNAPNILENGIFRPSEDPLTKLTEPSPGDTHQQGPRARGDYYAKHPISGHATAR